MVEMVEMVDSDEQAGIRDRTWCWKTTSHKTLIAVPPGAGTYHVRLTHFYVTIPKIHALEISMQVP